MDEQNATEVQTTTVEETPQGASETDWKAEARKWEKYAKENAAARKALDALKAAQMTEQERLVKRAEDAERKLAEAEAAVQHSKDVSEVSAANGIPAQLLEYCADRDAMERFAEQYKAAMGKVPSAPTAPQTRLVTGSDAKSSNADVFADMLEKLNF